MSSCLARYDLHLFGSLCFLVMFVLHPSLWRRPCKAGSTCPHQSGPRITTGTIPPDEFNRQNRTHSNNYALLMFYLESCSFVWVSIRSCRPQLAAHESRNCSLLSAENAGGIPEDWPAIHIPFRLVGTQHQQRRTFIEIGRKHASKPTYEIGTKSPQ